MTADFVTFVHEDSKLIPRHMLGFIAALTIPVVDSSDITRYHEKGSAESTSSQNRTSKHKVVFISVVKGQDYMPGRIRTPQEGLICLFHRPNSETFCYYFHLLREHCRRSIGIVLD
jgi:hypothetical protein